MARTQALSRPIIIHASAPKRRGGFRRAARRAVGFAKRHRGRARAAVPTVAMAMSGAAVGYAMSKGFLDKLPQIGGSKVLTLGLAGWAATKFSRNSTIRTAGLAALTAAAFDWGRVQGGGTSGIEGDSEPAY